MGILEFFGTLIKNDITSTSIQPEFRKKMPVNHLLIDFNSIIHVSSQKILVEVNVFMEMVLKNIYQERDVNNPLFTETFAKYGMESIQKKINRNTPPEMIVKLFHEHFDDKYMDKLIITLVINTVLSIIRTYCQNDQLKLLMLAIDGVPSKGKMVEQRQRRYIGAIMEEYKKKILDQYRDYLLEQKNYVYLATKDSIKWPRNKITPGTAFMHKLVSYLKSEKINARFKTKRETMEIVLSDMYQVGEGEKKIVNYVNKYLSGTNDTVMIYSPDADMILLCMLLPVKKVFMLRHNQQTSAQAGHEIYDLIDIKMLKKNIGYYINSHPDYPGSNYDINSINNDIVCLSTLFGNDFVPKIETLNVKKGFQNILDAYLKTLHHQQSKNRYLVESGVPEYKLNFRFLKRIIINLLPDERDFIKNNDLYQKYITIGQIKHVFNYLDVDSTNLVEIYNDFRREYSKLQHLIRSNGNILHYEKDERMMDSLKKSLVVIMDGKCINTTYLTNTELIKLLQKYYRKYDSFPWLNINLKTWSHSASDQRHKRIIKEKRLNDYQIEVYKFMNMLDEYYVKFNAQPLDLSENKIDDYYFKYFGVNELYEGSTDNEGLTEDAAKVMEDYLEGLLWVFRYYYNDASYVNTWYYRHERAPLLEHLSMYLSNINSEYFYQIYDNLEQYQVKKLSKYFNPVEQLIYVSPMTDDIIKLLPSNYQNYLRSDNMDPFLLTFFVDVEKITNRLWKQKVSKNIDCRSIPYFNKCFIESLGKPTKNDDKLFLKAIKKVKPNEASIRRSQSDNPDY